MRPTESFPGPKSTPSSRPQPCSAPESAPERQAEPGAPGESEGQVALAVIAGVEIERLDDASMAVGTTPDGRAVMVAGALPGEVLTMRVVRTSRRTGLLYGQIQEVTRPSPDRVPSPCANFLRCGGCDLLHANTEAQHRFKERKVSSALASLGVRVSKIVPAPANFGYRAFAKFVVETSGSLGSYGPHSHDVVSMSGCVVHAPEIEAIAENVRAWLHARAGPLDLRYVLMRASTLTRTVAITLVSRREEAEGLTSLVEHLKDDARVARIGLHANATEGDALLGDAPVRTNFDRGPLEERLDDIVHYIVEGAFSQVNPTAAARAYRLVSQLAMPVVGARVLDLYAGSGGIALRLLADGALHVVAVESSAAAIEAARNAAAANREGGLSLYAEPVEAFLRRMPPPESRYDVVVANPPRKGLSPTVLEGLARLSWERLVYMSCNPSSLARDLEDLGRLDPRIRFVSAHPVDLFPQTKHVETVVLAERVAQR
ncbi:MAG: 23S rRNA (uracil(1939)-C(5))-methyltransferase RlmD [Deltaproteobacteria bacterium]|nr:23S rRNA (uracil(1939)-C(5))-methyltransferase RlmD [Deltaproteobacteria bacterium]